MSSTTTTATAGATRRARPLPGPATGWLHLCNGLDPRRDGGMVPSILGMTGGLARRGESVAIVTPTPSRLDGDRRSRPASSCAAPSATWRPPSDGAEVVHLHGLWQGHTRRGAAEARRPARPLPHRRPRHGRAVGPAAQGAQEKSLHGTRRGEEPPAGVLPARPVPPRGRPPPGPGAQARRLPRAQRRRPRAVRGPAAAVGAGGRAPRTGGQVRPAVLRPPARQEGARPAGRGARHTVARDHPELHLLLAGHDDGAVARSWTRAEALGVATA